ncbi:uncharacterized protein BX663DRAFT_514207 [Cokeromyces recurvatus]|uniref:uncharacterized protein n=1 Tax=Cokeromyces recurvatus TaxID=90255 RepID=UPI002220BD34|nr:uncharacterized protein BX663DRAFT_514207 [Cokeromyces recurvatus]KAI7901355.1 hypothetical protein BX663DRAFT_514207 [Cokeromyces recurvatus]
MINYNIVISTLFVYLIKVIPIEAAEIKMFCKCFCGSNSTIFELPTTDLKPCGNCTKQFCLDNVKDGMCDGIADETCPSNDFKTACFARDSYKDEVIVRSFLIITICLILFSLVRPYIVKWQKKRAIRVQYQTVPNDEQ